MIRIWDLTIWQQDLIRAQTEPQAHLQGDELLRCVGGLEAACHHWSNDQRTYRQVLDCNGLIVAVLSYDIRDRFNWRSS